ncbi:hypothetical protein Bca101_065114 [Brassica carinata]
MFTSGWIQIKLRLRNGFQAFVVVGDGDGHVGLGGKCSNEVATAIRGGIILAKLSVVPVRRGYWGNKIGKPHTVPCKVTGKCGSVTATFDCLQKTYGFLTPEFWKETTFQKSPYQEYTDLLATKVDSAAKSITEVEDQA